MIINSSLNSFKSFRNLTQLNMSPLTILCGANSSGKSTILKSILTLKQSYVSPSARDTLILNGELVNNGFFEDVAFQRTTSEFSISNTFLVQNPFLDNSGKIKTKTVNVQTYKALRKLFLSTRDYPDSFEIQISSTFKSNSEKNPRSMPIIQKYILEIAMKLNGETVLSRITMERKDRSNFSLEWNNIPDVQHNLVSGKVTQCVAYFYGLQLGNVYIYAKNLPKDVIITSVLPNVYSMSKLAADQYQSISFLGPLRQAPARAYTYTNETLSIGTKGEYTPFVLAQNKGKRIKAILPDIENGKTEQNSTSQSLLEFTRQWLRYMNVDRINIDQHSEMVKVKIGDSNIADVGFGISQVLPVIVEGLSILPEQTLILEQPEIHLHPNMQMCLADFLISLVKVGKQVIIETHSDHIINRVIRRIMEEDGTFLLDNTSVYYVKRDDGVSQVKPITIDKVHGIAECPEDFFTQYSSEVDLIVRTGFENIRKGQLGDAEN